MDGRVISENGRNRVQDAKPLKLRAEGLKPMESSGLEPKPVAEPNSLPYRLY
jgi:hypothetical protein